MAAVLQGMRSDAGSPDPQVPPSDPRIGGLVALGAVPAGWTAIIDRCCARIGASLGSDDRFRFQRLQRHDGALRIIWSGRMSASTRDAVRDAVDLAEARSLCVCESCGEPGRLYRAEESFGVRCAGHAFGRPAFRGRAENLHLIQVAVAPGVRVVAAARYDVLSDRFVEIESFEPVSRGLR